MKWALLYSFIWLASQLWTTALGDDDDPEYAEDRLPPGQPVIPTTNLQRSRLFFDMVRRAYQQGDPTMGAITAPSGSGKTIMTRHLYEEYDPRAHTGLRAFVMVKVLPRSTPKAFVLALGEQLGETVRGQNIWAAADSAADAILETDTELVLVDEADRLDEDGFDVVRHIHDKTGRPIVVVGLPDLLNVIGRRKKFRTRVGLKMAFRPIDLDEMCTTILPQVVLPLWSFDPQNPQDQQLGERIWHMVGSSLRLLRSLLRTASDMASTEKATGITRDHISEAWGWVAWQEDQQRYKRLQNNQNESGNRDETADSDDQHEDEKQAEEERGEYEERSEKRQARKNQKPQRRRRRRDDEDDDDEDDDEDA
jgi:DNA transposition AAA+ family ATPase